MATRVFLLRHAESSAPDVFHGAESDVGLSERGQRQALAVAAILAEKNPHLVISSAMKRARDTAGPIACACGVNLIVEPDLHERRVGALSGTRFGGSDGVWPDTLRRWIAGETMYAPEGSESFEEIRARVLPVWTRITTHHEKKTLVIVAHGVVCKVLLLSLVKGRSAADWHKIGPMRNACITELLENGLGWQVIRLNEGLPAIASA